MPKYSSGYYRYNSRSRYIEFWFHEDDFIKDFPFDGTIALHNLDAETTVRMLIKRSEKQDA